MSRQNHCDFAPQLVSADFERDEVLELSLESSHELGPGSDAVRVEPLCWRQSFPSLRRLGFRHLHLFRWPKPATLKNLLWQNLCVILLYERFLNLYLVLVPQELDWIHAYFPVFSDMIYVFWKKVKQLTFRVIGTPPAFKDADKVYLIIDWFSQLYQSLMMVYGTILLPHWFTSTDLILYVSSAIL